MTLDTITEDVVLRVAFDIGGTFTDILITSSDRDLFAYKVLSTPDSLAQRVMECIHDVMAKKPCSRVGEIVHGTTIASNAVIENKRATTGYITTKGFRDDIDFARPQYQVRSEAVGQSFPPPTPLVPRHLRMEVAERIAADGSLELALDPVAVEACVQALLERGIQALAICLINSFVNPRHEQAIERIARRLAPDLEIVMSHAVSPQLGEYERASTTVLHASLMPVICNYLARLEADFKGLPELVIMQANGGVVPAGQAKRAPANLIESGPAAGVLAAAALARACGIEKAVALDMGGTTVKVCLIENGRPRETMQMEVSLDTNSRLVRGSGHALRTSGFDLVEIGAGGGSIAWIDDGGALRVGPHSAGADPGPASYGLGGTRPTITDAAVVLGYLNPAAIAGGTVAIEQGLAQAAIQQDVATAGGMDVRDAAYGICRVAVATMRRAVRTVTVQRGCDPRECSLIPFGGAGPLLAAALADDLEISSVYVPPRAGLFSALGLLSADMRFDHVAPLAGFLDDLDSASLSGRYEEMFAKAVKDLANSGIDLSGAVTERSIDLRYVRQASELTIALPNDAGSVSLGAELARVFHQEHGRQYGYSRAHERILTASIRLRISVKNDHWRLEDFERELVGGERVDGMENTRPAYFGKDVGELPVRVVARRDLQSRTLAGPLIVEEFDTTLVVPPGWKASLGGLGSIVLERAQ